VTAVLASSVDSAGHAVDPTSTFPTDSAKIYLAFEARDLPAGTHLEAIWIAERVDAPVPAGYEVTRSTITVQGNQVGNFALSRPNPGFPTGQYHVDLYLDGSLIGTYPFTVK
jgi:hypothetical protein